MSQDTRTYTPDEILKLGMDCLVEEFGIVNAELFINTVRSTRPDYTLWRRHIFDDMTEEELDDLVRQSLKDNPFE